MRASVLAVLMLAVWPLEVSGQTFSVNAGGTVASVVSVARVSDLSFGPTAIVPGTATTVAPANGALVRVDYNETASVTAPNFIVISGPAGAPMRIDLVCAQHPTPSAPAPTVFAVPCAGGFVPPMSGNIGGTHYIYVGGVIGVAATTNAPAGNYAGTFSVTATYVNY